METIKEADDEDGESPESGQFQTLIGVKTNPDLVNTLEEHVRKGGAFPRNFSTMSFLNRGRKSSIISNYSNLSNMDFTGSSLQLHLQVPLHKKNYKSVLQRNYIFFRTMKIQFRI